MNFLESIDSMQREVATTLAAFEANPATVTGGDGRSVRVGRRQSPEYQKRLGEAVGLVADVYKGRRPVWQLREAMTRADFPNLFGDILDRQILANYQETPQVYRQFCRIGTVSDFRQVKRFTVSGAESVLPKVNEQAEYPVASIADASPYTYKVEKYGRRVPFSWEAMVNDDLDALRSIPERLGRAARRSESKFATSLFVDASGPNATFFSVGNANRVTSNPVLSIASLQSAMALLGAMKDAEGEPVVVETAVLVVPPALEIVARNILNATQIEIVESGGTSNQKLIAENWMRNRVQLVVDPYHPIVASTANGNTSWYLFASPSSGRPALEVGFLRGHETPELFIKQPNVQAAGGGADPMNGDFDTDSIEYKVRHVFGGALMDPKMAVASNGSGS